MNRVYAWTVPTAAVALLALIVALNPAADPGEAGHGERGPQVVKVTLSEFKIEPKTVTAVAGRDIRLEIANAGAVPHNLAVEGHGVSATVDGGGSTTLDVDELPAGTYALFCAIAGHRESGMEATLTVGDSGAEAPARAMTAEEMDASYMAGVKAFPAKTRAKGGQPLRPRIEAGVKVFELTAEEIDWEVAPGDVRKAMAYDGQVPGPEIRVELGDRVRVIFHNQLRESSAIHFHGLEVPNEMDGVPGITQDIVKPGASWTHEFPIVNAGSHMYHSHMNGATQIPMGLLGAFIVEGPGEPKADVETTMILNDGPLGYTINGKGFPATDPVVAKPGQTIRVRYMNEGLQGHPMHLHGQPQTVFAKDGYPLPQPYKADTIWVAPGERYDVLLTARPGLWAWHCHILSHAETQDGMFGMVTALIAK